MAEVTVYTTPVFRLSFPHVFKPQEQDGWEPKYGITAIWDPSKFGPLDKKRWAILTKAMDSEAQHRFKKSLKDLPANYKKGIRKAEEKADMEGFEPGMLFASITSKLRPGVAMADKELGGLVEVGPEHHNEEEIYAGIWAMAKVTVYSYDNKNKGVSLGLNSLRKVKDDARIDMRKNAAQDFEDDEVDEDWLDGDQEEGGPGGDEDDEIPF